MALCQGILVELDSILSVTTDVEWVSPPKCQSTCEDEGNDSILIPKPYRDVIIIPQWPPRWHNAQLWLPSQCLCDQGFDNGRPDLVIKFFIPEQVVRNYTCPFIEQE